MAHVLTPSFRGAPVRRLANRRRGVDWRVVAFTACSAVTLIAMLGRPI